MFRKYPRSFTLSPPVTFKFTYGHQSRGTSTASAASSLTVIPPRIFFRKKWKRGSVPVSHVYLHICYRARLSVLHYSSFLSYARNTEITCKNSPMTVMRMPSRRLFTTARFTLMNDGYKKNKRRRISKCTFAIDDIYTHGNVTSPLRLV